ncbi:golgin subfamily A member 8C-like isoform X5 [Symphalangus syndactylus]|uniref:golgin subfamily A member 8C-like isoform X5 n=1 Tax=Symphalangus syndactylus TaxID=9590 RepID=UPI00300553F8
MAEETRQSKLAAAKKKFKAYSRKNSPRVPTGAKRNRKTNGSIPEAATSRGCHPNDCSLYVSPNSCSTSSSLHAPQSPCQEPAVVRDSRSIKINLLKNTIKSLKQQKKDLEHQLEKEKKENNRRHQAKRGLEVQIKILNTEKKKLHTDISHTKRSLRYFEEQSKDLAGQLQCSLQRKEELERVLPAVAATQNKKLDGFLSHSRARMERMLQQSLQDQALLKAQLTQLKETFKQGLSERDEYAQCLKGEKARWQQRMTQMSQEVDKLKKENNHYMQWVEELERLSELQKQTAEPLPPELPAVPSEVELQHLRKELERVAGELQAQVEKNQRISFLNRVQEERLQKQEERLQEQQERLQQLAKPQSVFEELNKSTLCLEQQVKELQEKLDEMKETETSAQKEPEAAVLAPGTGGESISFMDHLEEKADLSELVKKQEIRFTQYWRERCHQKTHHLLTEPGCHAKDAALGGGDHEAGPGQEGDEGEAAGAAADGIGACGNYNNGHRKFLAAAQNPADEPGPGAPAPQELGAADKHGDLCEVSLTTSAQGEAREGPTCDNPTAQPIVRDHQEHPGLGSIGCLPFFCWAWLPRRRR